MKQSEIDLHKIHEEVEKYAQELRKLTLYIHSNPELGMEEHKACRAQKELLEKYGFEVETGFCGIETAYKACYKGKKPGPKIAMLAEYDALPELGHGCGHNLIAMVGVGAGLAMRTYADEYGGEIYVIGTPAEETAGAKVDMAKTGAFDGFDVAMMAHPMDAWYDTTNTMAINCRKISFYGKPAHAAAAPQDGINALDAMINFYNLVNALRQQTKDDARIHGVILHGGTASNVIPEFTDAEFCIRASKCAYLEELTKKVEDCAKGAALGTGASMTFEPYLGDFKDMSSNLYLAGLHAESMEALGVSVIRTNGAPMPGSTDLGDVSYACPAIHFTFDISDGRP
ncbi:MAG: M20 family metallopeptidase, partial [Emergencia sp.]